VSVLRGVLRIYNDTLKGPGHLSGENDA
jgi:hypothetical protein